MGLNSKLIQLSVSFNKKRGTLRGMHYQIAPYQETKLVRCNRGKIFDVIIDLRENSKTYRQWFGIEMDSNNKYMLYVPEGFAHGFQTLEDNTEVFYQISQEYMPEYARGKLWNDPIFNISWPIKSPIISDKDEHWPKEL
ncbi:dTDP-4-dehydrorhamnose 3,5-epimerase [Nitrosarchaeum koreense MY1]|uniref:dTDP-4-dehydrorhamnose 3,5-epimerase n=2 Tax=Nitrosarchaeum TaxID=1007082 RepID=F9CY99_9ARCH|nr:dTDP-4-dehydrorhamnose 3,5-epimerase [Nitrosarchaeum koreense MY1]